MYRPPYGGLSNKPRPCTSFLKNHTLNLNPERKAAQKVSTCDLVSDLFFEQIIVGRYLSQSLHTFCNSSGTCKRVSHQDHLVHGITQCKCMNVCADCLQKALTRKRMLTAQGSSFSKESGFEELFQTSGVIDQIH